MFTLSAGNTFSLGAVGGTSRGSHRRDVLRAGALGLGGLALPDLLRLRAAGGKTRTPRAVIMVCLAGGPSHLETYDMKPDAPADYRGAFSPVRTNLPGLDICEHMPLQSKIADKLAVVRTVQFVEPMQHELEEVYTGFPKAQHRPSFGSVVSKFRGGDPKLPSYVSLEYGTATTSYESPQYLGAAHRPLQLAGTDGVRNLTRHRDLTPTKFDDRKDLLKSFDTMRRAADAKHERSDTDAYTARALDIITSPKARDAFDLSQEPLKVRAKYGETRYQKYAYAGKAADSQWDGHQFLLARRLVEAGVPVVTLRAGQWDHHGNVLSGGGTTIFNSLKTMLPLLDRGIYALVTDLHERGLDKDVLVLVWGEFGRTPKISQNGRDHWPDAGFALFAGAVNAGQVVGQTDSRGARPKARAVTAQNVLGTVYHTLGIDWRQKVADFGGRPVQLLDDGEPIAELVN